MEGLPTTKEAEDLLLVRAERAKRESRYIDFKESFDPGSARDWVEIIKDIVAMANSGGGVIMFGVRNDGTPSGLDVAPLLATDSAVVTDKIAAYTGEQFSEFSITEAERGGQRVALMRIMGVSVPMVFQRPGTYDAGQGKQKTAFSVGTVYFRHGSKSEPGESGDLRKSIERELARIRKSWLGNIKKVVEAPRGQAVQVVPAASAGEAVPAAVKVVDNRRAPTYGLLDPSTTHPYRQKEVLAIVNKRLASGKRVNTYDLFCARKVHDIEKKREYFYEPKFGSPQYSDAFADWLVRAYQTDPKFFEQAREDFKAHPRK